MADSNVRNWLLVLPLLVALVGTGVWIALQPEGTATPVDGNMGELALVTDTDRTPVPLDFEGSIPMTVYQSPTCGCCGLWVDHVEENGFEVDAHLTQDMGTVKEGFAVPYSLASCHTAVVGGYVIEGHVPAADIRRLLAEVPEARGLTVPGMPIGSPGMEVEGEEADYEVLLFNERGETRVWNRYGPDRD